MLRRYLIVLVLVVTVGGLVRLATTGGSPASPSSSSLVKPPLKGSGPYDPLANGTKVALGVNLDSPTTAAIDAFSRLLGVRPLIVMWYQQWSEPLFYIDQMRDVSSEGAIPMITWDPILNGVGIPLSEIVAGRYDGYIRSEAEIAARWKHRIYLRLAHEMNLRGSPFGPGREGNTPATFVAAWRHIVRIFRQVGAANVEWVWSPNVACGGACPFGAFYPGDDWVNWAALDGYNYSSVDNDPWLTFAQIFGPSYAGLIRLTGKPVMIGETGSVESGGNKAQWIAGMGHALATQFTRVRAIVWFQRVKEADWRVNSSPQSLAAFRILVRSPLFDFKTG